MALSDQLLTLSEQAGQLEASAEAVKTKDTAKIAQRKAALESSIQAARTELGNEMVAAGDQIDADWATEKVEISKSFDTLKQKRSERHARWAAKHADRTAEAAEDDALDEIDFAIYAIEEAEYAILDAVDARAAADEKAAAAR